MATKKSAVAQPKWEIKNRTYYLLSDRTPITYTLASKHGSRHPLLWFDDTKGYARELRYASNQASLFVDEQVGYSTLRHIVFTDGTLTVTKDDQGLQKLLSVYHPQLGKTYEEFNPAKDAKEELFDLEIEIEALNLAKDLDVEHAEAVLRVEQGSGVNKMTSKEIKRDILLFAKKSPKTFISLVNDDNIQLRNFGIKAIEAGIINLSQDQKTFAWASNGKKLLTVPFEENPYSALASWLKTDEGVEVYKSIEKKQK